MGCRSSWIRRRGEAVREELSILAVRVERRRRSGSGLEQEGLWLRLKLTGRSSAGGGGVAVEILGDAAGRDLIEIEITSRPLGASSKSHKSL